MKAVRIHTPGGPEVMRYEDVPEPTPKAGEALIKVEAAGINYIDVYFRSGQYKAELPLRLHALSRTYPAAVSTFRKWSPLSRSMCRRTTLRIACSSTQAISSPTLSPVRMSW